MRRKRRRLSFNAEPPDREADLLMRSYYPQIIICLAALLLISTTPASAKIGDEEAGALQATIAKGTPAEVDEAVATIKTTFARSDDDAYMCIQYLKSYWLQALVKRERHADIAELCWLGVLARPHDNKRVPEMLRWRIESLQALDRHDDALKDAVRLFNVSTVKDAGEVLVLVSGELVAAHPDDPQIGERFKAEQIAGAQKPGTKSPLMLGVDLSSPELEKVLEAVSRADDFRHQVGMGNVLLMLGRGEQAKAHFESQSESKHVKDGVGRAIKAIDGTIGRANAWAQKHL